MEIIKFFSKHGCSLCNMAKQRAKSYTNIKYITLEDLDNEYAMTKVPVLLVNGTKYETLKEIYDALAKYGVK